MEGSMDGMRGCVPIFTDHARVRCQQRGKRMEVVTFVCRFGDMERRNVPGRRLVTLSRKGSMRLLRQGAAPALIERALRVAVILSNDDGAVITVLDRAA
jgi:hypothetical protein